jgi:hypothetical protein
VLESLIREGAILAINPVSKEIIIRKDMVVASILLRFRLPGITCENLCTGPFRASARKKAVHIRTKACDALRNADKKITDKDTRINIFTTVRVEISTSTALFFDFLKMPITVLLSHELVTMQL